MTAPKTPDLDDLDDQYEDFQDWCVEQTTLGPTETVRCKICDDNGCDMCRVEDEEGDEP